MKNSLHFLRLAAAGVLVIVAPAALAQAAMPTAGVIDPADPMTSELQRFVRAYRFGATVIQQVRFSIAQAEQKPGADRKILECLATRLSPRVAEEVGMKAAAETFHDRERLRATSAFLESAAGRRILDWSEVNSQRAASPKAMAALPMPQLNAAETRQVEEWQRNPAHLDFKRFVAEGLPKVGRDPQFVESMQKLRQACEAEAAASRAAQ
jgi:hypothetical protein